MDNAGIQAMMPEENVYQVAQPIVKTSNGRLLYVRLDIDKPMNTYLDLRQWFNATQGDQDNILPIMIFQNGMPMNLNGYTVQIQGMYPDGETPFVISASGTGSGSGMYNFHFPAGVFQVMGRYTFQFKFSNGTSTLTSKVCFFDVEPDMLTMAYNFNDGVNPYDNQYQQWKSKVEAEINQLQGQINTAQDSLKTITGTATNTLSVLQDYEKNAQGFVDTAMTAKFGDENTWTGKQHFNGGLTFSNNAQGDTLVANTVDTGDLTVTGNATLPGGASVSGLFKIEDSLRKSEMDGGISTMLNATGGLNPISTINSKFWCWGERYEVSSDPNNWPHFFFYFLFNMSCDDVGKPIAQFKSPGFLNGANNGPVTIPVEAGSAWFHLDSNSNCINLDGVSNISGNVWVRAKFWI